MIKQRKLKYILLIVCLLSINHMAIFGNTKRISINHEYVSFDLSETAEQVERNAIQEAKQKALEEAFGLNVVGMVNMVEQELEVNGEFSNSSSFFSSSKSLVRGEWIETIKQEIISKVFEDGCWRVRVYVEGRARNYSTEKPAIKYAFINNTHDREKRTLYYDGDDVFLRFMSPVSGALCVYLVDRDSAYCFLPYSHSDKGHQPIEANKDYLFFSKTMDPAATEYGLSTQDRSIQNEFYVVFSPNIFTKAADHHTGTDFRNQLQPRGLSHEDFLHWLSRNQARDENMVVLHEVVTIQQR